MKTILASACLSCVAFTGFTAESPRVVAIPPTFAVRDLCVTKDGEIRHYGWTMAEGKKRRVFLASGDNGENWSIHFSAEGVAEAMVRSRRGDGWLYARRIKDGQVIRFFRSKEGPGGKVDSFVDYAWPGLELRQMLELKSRARWLACFSETVCADGDCYHAVVAWSDGGETWTDSPAEASFWQANTMPYLLPLKDGRLLFFWNNTQMLPTRPLKNILNSTNPFSPAPGKRCSPIAMHCMGRFRMTRARRGKDSERCC